METTFTLKRTFFVYSSLGTDKFLCGSLIAKKILKKILKILIRNKKKFFLN